MTAVRAFLGWDRPLLAAAADHLVARYAAGDPARPALRDLIVAVPGRRASRRLLELLIDRLPDGVPPRLVTAGVLVDELVGDLGRVAGRVARTLAWAEALASLPPERLVEFVPHPPAADDLLAWRELGALARSLHGTLAAADRDFHHAVEPALALCGAAEAQRWRVLDRARAAYLRRLQADGVVDPHESRRDAVREGRLRREARVVLLGVVELPGLVRAALSHLEHPPEALIFAPEQEAARFDGWGAVRAAGASDAPASASTPEAPVRDADAPLFAALEADASSPDDLPPPAPLQVPLDEARWFVEDRPADQAERVLSVLAGISPAPSAAEISVGLLDGQVGAPLARRLADHGVVVRDVAGTPLERTGPAQLLAATAAWLDGRGVDAFAALLRHPDLALDAGSPGRCLASDLDQYRAQHLPAHLAAKWLALGADLDEEHANRHELREAAEERDRRRALVAASEAWSEQLGELSTGRARPLAAWTAPLRAWLTAVYGARELRPAAREQDRRLDAALRALGAALEELAGATAWERPVPAAAAVTELLAALEGGAVPPAPAADAVELLGWLELPLDDAPVLVLTGVNDGRLPEPMGGLPEALCTALGLPDDAARHARDALLLTTILRSRAEVTLITGRRSRENDPLRPSRLLFACDDEQLVSRVERLVRAGKRRPVARGVDGAASDAAGAGGHAPGGASGDTSSAGAASPLTDAPRPLPMAATPPVISRLSATGFRAYLTSPYRFYLERVLYLRGVGDGGAEMDPLVFGTLAHAVLEGLAGHEAGASTNAKQVDEFLQRRLARLAAERFGKAALPAVTLQLMQLRARLSAFARWQAGWAGAGWRIRHAEWAPREPATLEVDGEPFVISGIIDRIDQNEQTGQWAILDYKTSEVGADPARTHRGWETLPDPDKPGEVIKRRIWTDLQLPLYRVLAAELELPADVRLGYVNLPADLEGVGAELVPLEDGKQGRRSWEGWTPELLDTAVDKAREIIRALRAGRFTELGEVSHHRADEPLVRALAGLDLLSAPPPELGDGDADGDGGDGESAAGGSA